MSKPKHIFLTESYIIRQSDPRWQELDRMSYLAKNIFNDANYVIRQAFFADRDKGIHHDKQKRTWTQWLSFIRLKETLRKKQSEDYSALPKRVAETCIKAVISIWRGYDVAWFDWQKQPQKYLGEPNIPRYKPKGDVGRASCYWNNEAVHKQMYNKQGLISLSGCDVKIVPGDHVYQQIRRIEKLKKDEPVNLHERIGVIECLPRSDHYLVTISYIVTPTIKKPPNPTHVMGIDLGVNNLMAITSNLAGFQPILVNGRPVKSANQYFNKRRADLQSKLPEGQYHSKRLTHLYRKRSRRIKDYLHRASNLVIKSCLEADIGIIVIGKNKNWQQKANLGKRNNQNFVSIPHTQLIEMIQYKAQLVGVRVIVHEESYTSKCSFLDGESVGKHETYAGVRVNRGLFRAGNGRLINADVNASYNIIRHVIPNAFAEGIEDAVAVHPLLISV